MIAISIRIVKRKIGIVIFVGSAARLATNANAIAPIAVMNKPKFIVVFITVIAVNGVSTHP